MLNLNSTPTIPVTQLPAAAGLDINQMIDVMQDLTGELYAVDGTRFHYSALVPCDVNSSSPVILLERNMNGFYVVDRAGNYNAYAQARFASHIALMNEVSEIVDEADYEGFAVTIRVSTDVPAPATEQTAPDAPAPTTTTTAIVPVAPLATLTTPVVTIRTHSAPIGLLPAPVAPIAPATAPTAPIITPVTLIDEQGRILVQTATGWQAESASSPGTIHTTSADGSRCNCPGFTGRYRKCWHTALVRKHVADKRRAERENALPVSPRRGRSRMFKGASRSADPKTSRTRSTPRPRSSRMWKI